MIVSFFSFTCKPVRLFHVKIVPGYPLNASNSSWIMLMDLQVLKTKNTALTIPFSTKTNCRPGCRRTPTSWRKASGEKLRCHKPASIFLFLLASRLILKNQENKTALYSFLFYNDERGKQSPLLLRHRPALLGIVVFYHQIRQRRSVASSFGHVAS